MRSHDAPEHEHDAREHEHDERARSPLHHPRRTAAAAPSARPVQRRATATSTTFGAAVNAGIHVQARGDLNGPDVHQMAAYGVASGAASLPHAAAIQASFGHHDVSGVRAHVGGNAAEAAAAIGAEAYATGDSVAFSASPDLHLAAHEAAHVVQQRAGVRLSGGVGTAGDEYERHADAVADLVVQGKSAQSLLDTYAHRGAAGGSAVQKQDTEGGETEAPSEAEMCAGPVDNLQPSLAQEGMLALARERATTIGTGVPSELVNDVMAQVQAMIDDGRAGSTELMTDTLEGTWVNHDWQISATVERRAVADCGSARGTGTTGREGTATTRSRGGEDTTRHTAGIEGTGSAGRTAGASGGPVSSGGGTARGSREHSRTRRSGVSAESHGRSSSASVAMEVDGRVYEYIVTFSIMTEISRSPEWTDPATAYAGVFRESFEATPWGPVTRTVAIGTRREDEEHAATRRPSTRRAPHRPVEIR
jgi:hypothetical protein